AMTAASDAELAFKPAFELRQLIATKQVSPVELTEFCLRRIEALNPKLNAFITVAADQALDDARGAEAAVTRGASLGPLHGVPVSVKDLEPVKGIRCTRGSLVFKDTIADRDEIAISRLRAAGAMVIGKTNTPEFGRLGTTQNRLGDDCRNPWDSGRTTGGSSGGAAASVASGMVPIAQGSDGGGSIRIPSSFCGNFGIKATQGRVPRRNQGPGSWHPVNFSCIGPMTRTVRDAAIMLTAMSGPAPDAEHMTLQAKPPDFEKEVFGGDESGTGRTHRRTGAADGGTNAPTDIVKGLRIAWTPDFGGAGVDSQVKAACEKAVGVFHELGATVEECKFDMKIDWTWQTYYTITAVKAASAFGQLFDEKRDLLTDYVVGDITLGRRITSEGMNRALCELEQHRAQFAKFFAEFDLLITPTTAVPAFKLRQNPGIIGGRHVDARWGFYPYTFPFNMAGNPAANVPCGFSAEGLPIGLQIVGRWGDEVSVLRASAAFESVRPWGNRRPPVS
ncbi:MAG: amidase, partial [Chloroflexi bacterium]|nr:amidase [Chloroflexota bacterium]